MLAAAGLQTAAAIVVGLTTSFWVALVGLLGIMGAMGLMTPVRQSYIQQLIPSEQRATVTSFDSMVGGVGGTVGQLGLGWIGEQRSVRTAFLAGGLATVAVLPLVARVRSLGSPADDIAGRRAGADSVCAASGLPPVTTLDHTPVGQPEPNARA
jgi:MFS family permease